MYSPQGGMPPGWGPNTVVVPAADFEDGRLPGICAVTGAPASANLPRRYASTPQWVGCLFLISWFALIVAYLFTHQSSSGVLPVTSPIAARVQRLNRTGSLAFFAGIVVCIVAAIAGAVTPGLAGEIAVTILLVAGVVAFIAAVVMSVMESQTLGVRGRVTKDGFGTRWVQLQGVNPAFVQAVANTRR